MAHPGDEALAAFALGESIDGLPEHVAACEQCRATVAELQATVDLARRTPAEVEWIAPPASVLPAIRAQTASGKRRSWPRRLAVAAAVAAVGVVIGLGAGRLFWGDTPGSTTVSQVALDALDTGQQGGSAQLIDSRSGMALRIDTTKPLDAGSGYLQVWLLNTDGKRMVPVGVLRGEGVETFPMSASLVKSGYLIVDISQEQYDNNPAHSGDSLLRGKLSA
ncbi:anti-sigma-K factor rskA [Branchiibius hedensis]|uniref:Anti-sigma-K factor rskA n=1 Tax=Branchiibius hedensis TaxID=672460 RepID=A0A2Y8ZW67_9MICO|nr:anti-sigma-K factor rskA [Branchiibius hedensis]SSA36185.1 Anti-sigma-K factor rskA [Branchiibius hedensis]